MNRKNRFVCFSSKWLLGVLLMFSISVKAAVLQDSALITINANNIPIEQVFRSIESQTNYSVFYNTKVIDPKEKVSVNISRERLTEAMDKVLRGRNLKWVIKGKGIIIMEKGAALPAGGNPVQAAEHVSVADSLPRVTVSGTVTSDEGFPLPGATVIVNGGKIGTTTDGQGKFSLSNVRDKSIITISYTGYQPQEYSIKGLETLIVKLKRTVGTLDEQVVIAYGTSSRRKLTGSISRVTSEEISRQPVSNPLAAMIGRMPGVQITQTSGVPGGSFTVQIRGRNSISQGNDPFYIVDGVPFSGSSISSGISSIVNGGSPLNNINPSDIESIEVLKDADATAIYGSRGANGVVLITTKKGKQGKTSLNFNIYHGFAKVGNKLNVLTTEQYLEMRNEALANDGVILTPTTPNTSDIKWGNERNTDWQEKLIGGTANITDAQIAVSGGSELTQFRIGTGLHKESTVFPGNYADTKSSVYFSINHNSLDKRFKLIFSGTYLDDKNNLSRSDFTALALTLPPNAPKIYNEDGSLNWENSTWSNPYAELLKEYRGSSNNLIGNTSVSYEIINGLYIKSSFGYTSMRMQELNTLPISSFDPATKPVSTNTQFNDNNIKTWVIEPQIEYKSNYGKLRVGALIGSTFQQSLRQGQTLIGDGYTNDALLKDIKSAATVTVFNTVYNKYRYNAVFGRINLEWDGKYIVNLTGRRDGSSRFGPGKQFADFGAVGAAWIFTNEDFIRENNKILSFGKIRASYGSTGNDPIKDYGFLDLWISTANPYLGTKGLYTSNLFNPDFAWEVNKKLEGAIEIAFLQDRIYLSTSYYRNRSGNQLVGTPLALMTGFNTITANLNATVQNSGWEFGINSKIINNKNFKWALDLNLTLPESKLVEYPNFEKSSTAPLLYAIGYPLNVAKAYSYIGVNSETGVYEYTNNAGAPTSTPNFLTERNVALSLLPEYYGGVQNQFTYKNWDINFLFQFTKQTGNNYLGGFMTTPGLPGNQPDYVMNRWKKSGDVSDVQRFTQNTGSTAYRAYSSSFNGGSNKYSDASFIRLKNISLSYDLPVKIKSKIKLQSSKIFLQGQNVFTVTKYKGIDPETQSFQSLPTLRVLAAGIQLTF